MKIQRKKIFEKALTHSLSPQHLLEKPVLKIDDLNDKPLPKSQTMVTDIIFVIHGICDQGFWTKKIARKIRCLSDEQEKERLLSLSN